MGEEGAALRSAVTGRRADYQQRGRRVMGNPATATHPIRGGPSGTGPYLTQYRST